MNIKKEIKEKGEQERSKFTSILRKESERDQKTLHKETVKTLRAEGKIRRVWNADVEKIEEELADTLEQIEEEKQSRLAKLQDEWNAKKPDERSKEAYDKRVADISDFAEKLTGLVKRRAAADTKNAIFGKSPLDGFTSGIESANKSLGTLGDNVEKLTTGTIKNFADGVADAFVAWTSGSKSAGEAFRDFTELFLREIHKQITQMAVAYMMQQVLGWAVKVVGAATSSSSSPAVTENTAGLLTSGSTFNANFSAGGGMYTSNATGGILPNIKSFRKFSSGGMTSSPALALLGDNASSKELVIPSESIHEDKVSGYVRNKGEESRDNVIINLFDKALVPALIAEYPDSVLNLVNADVMRRGITYQVIKSVR